jgi:AraC-like DNA-binding protein
MTGEYGNVIRGALGRNGRVAKIGRVLRRIHAEFHSQLSAEALAEEACMCLTAFHENFRAVTGSTPLQYLKSVRLHAARMLMLRDGISAAAASSRVGYESPSHFSREFKREFGKTPAQIAHEEGLDAAASGAPTLRSELAYAEHRARSEDRKLSPQASGPLDR